MKSNLNKFLTAASCPKKDFYTPPTHPGGKKGGKIFFSPEPVLLLS